MTVDVEIAREAGLIIRLVLDRMTGRDKEEACVVLLTVMEELAQNVIKNVGTDKGIYLFGVLLQQLAEGTDNMVHMQCMPKRGKPGEAH